MNMKKIFSLVFVAIAALLALTCGTDKPTEVSPLPGTSVAATFLKSSLTDEITHVTLLVVINDEAVYTDTAVIVDGKFDFGSINLPAGEAKIALAALDAEGGVIYAGETTATIIGSEHTEIDVELLPIVRMIKLSPYHDAADVCGRITSTLEFFNVPRFSEGWFTIETETGDVQFTGEITAADPAWGTLEIAATDDYTSLSISCARTNAESDNIPADVHSLLDIEFLVNRPGEMVLTLTVDSLKTTDGLVPDVANIYQDGQRLSIGGSAVTGTISGVITDASTSEPISGVQLTVGEPATAQTQTDQFGQYQFPGLALGAYYLNVNNVGYASQHEQVVLSCEDISLEADFTLQPLPGSVTITVFDENNLPTDNIIVIREDEFGWPIDSLTTHNNGQVTWTELPGGGRYIFSAVAPGHDVPEGELWGHTDIVTVPYDGAAAETITRYFPFAGGVQITDRTGSAASDFRVGDTIFFAIEIDNRDAVDHQITLTSQGSRNRGANVDFTLVNEMSVPAFTVRTAENYWVADTQGSFYFRPWKTETLIDLENRTTDSRPWPNGISFTVGAALPDLIITSVETTNLVAAPGEGFMVNAILANDGPGVSGAFKARAVLSEQPVTTADQGTEIGFCRPTGIGPGENETCEITATVPTSLAPGTYYLCIIADANREIAETDEENNWHCAAQTLDVSPPTLSVDPLELTFSAVQYGDLPAAQQLAVSNTGGGTLSWTAEAGDSWLTLEPTSDSGNKTSLTVSIATTDLLSGTHNATVTIVNAATDGDTAFVDVQLNLAPAPTGNVAVTVYDEDSTGTAGISVVRYTSEWTDLDTATTAAGGTATFNEILAGNTHQFNAFSPSAAVPGSFDLWGEAIGITVIEDQTASASIYRHFPFVESTTITDADGLPATEFYPGEEVNVTFTVAHRYAEALATTVRFQLTQTPAGPPDYDMTSDPVSIPALGTALITFTVSPETLGDYYLRSFQTMANIRGVNQATDSHGWPGTPALSIVPVPCPDLQVTLVGADADLITPGGALTVTARVKNIGASASSSFDVFAYLTVDGDLIPDENELMLGQVTYNPLADGDSVEVVVDGLVPQEVEGMYYLRVAVASNEGSEECDLDNNTAVSTEPITVTASRPQFEPDTLYFTAWSYEEPPTPQSVSLTNAGGGVLSWNIANPVPWLDISPSSGTGEATLEFTITSAAFNPTTFVEEVIVNSTTSPDADTLLLVYEVKLPGWLFGGPGDQEGFSIDTAAGEASYIIAGYTLNADRDVYLLEVGGNGFFFNDWVYDYDFNDVGTVVITTQDNGYAIAGYTHPGSPEWLWSEAYLLKVNSAGSVQWQDSYGCGECLDGASGITELPGGGYVMVGFSYDCSGYSVVGGFTGCTRSDAYVVQIDAAGKWLWHDWYYDGDWNELLDVVPNSDGSLFIVGQTKPPLVDPEWAQAWLLTVIDAGEGGSGSIILSEQDVGALGSHDAARSVIDLGGGQRVVAGYTSTGGAGSRDMYIFNTDGNSVSNEGRAGTADQEVAWDMAIMGNGYIVVGQTQSPDGTGPRDAYVAYFDFSGNVIWQRAFGGPEDDCARGVVATNDGCIIVGVTKSYGAQGKDVWVLRLNQDGTIWEEQ